MNNLPEHLKPDPDEDIERLMISRLPDDYIEIKDEKVRVLRISLGGVAERGYYCTFRGEPAEVIELLEKALWGMRVKFAAQDTPPGQGKS
jgi:hypothetical protein